MEELLPINHWHMCTNRDQHVPVLNDIIDHQHHAQLHIMTSLRDRENQESRWTSTALAFANTVHPPQNTSYWAAARRALIIFDWLGHGRNKAKPIPRGTLAHDIAAQCPHCSALDSQEHSMLDCPYPPFQTQRRATKIKQAAIASRIINKPGISEPLIHFTQNICHASWISTPQTKRLWLGTWQLHTLNSMLGIHAETPLSMSDRYKYIKIVRKLTAPLLLLYHKMIDVNTKKTQRYPPTQDRTVHTTIPYDHNSTHDNTAHTLSVTLQSIEQDIPDTARPPGISNLAHLQSSGPFTISDAAFSVESADRRF